MLVKRALLCEKQPGRGEKVKDSSVRVRLEKKEKKLNYSVANPGKRRIWKDKSKKWDGVANIPAKKQERIAISARKEERRNCFYS